MDGNKDDALRCLKIGKEALQAGDKIRALKFVTKARRLDPNLSVDDLLSAIDEDGASDQPKPVSDDKFSSKPSDGPSIRKRVVGNASSTSSSSATADATPSFTEEQVAIVRQIKRKKDYYEILGLEKSCSVEDVRKAYRKLSLKVHPDKNQAPGAEEAFKAVSKAFQCLSNEESRRKYDVSGTDDELVYERHRHARHGARGSNGYYDMEVDADEIFRNFFFGAGMPPSTQFRGFQFGGGMGQRMADDGSSGFNVRALIQLLPVLLILVLSFMPSSDPVYILSKSYPYEYKFMTQKGVPYYVKSGKFEQEYPPGTPGRVALEQRVERDYFSILSQNCRMEMQRYQWGIIQEMPHCDMLKQFENVA